MAPPDFKSFSCHGCCFCQPTSQPISLYGIKFEEWLEVKRAADARGLTLAKLIERLEYAESFARGMKLK